MSDNQLRVVWIYPDLLSTYGDQGNVLVVERRARQRGLDVARLDVRSDQPIPTSGDIYLIGGGDPSLAAGGMRDLAKDVRRAGVRRVSGRVIADDTVFDRLRGVPDSNWGPSEWIAPLATWELVWDGIALVPAAIGGALVGAIAALITLVMRGETHSEGGGHA